MTERVTGSGEIRPRETFMEEANPEEEGCQSAGGGCGRIANWRFKTEALKKWNERRRVSTQ